LASKAAVERLGNEKNNYNKVSGPKGTTTYNTKFKLINYYFLNNKDRPGFDNFYFDNFYFDNFSIELLYCMRAPFLFEEQDSDEEKTTRRVFLIFKVLNR
tara:strand:+ start:444 stop:743 length:300 start_codon:yes stop_codon:yes gene_type:complete